LAAQPGPGTSRPPARRVPHTLAGTHREHISTLDGVQAARFFVVESWTPTGPTWDGLGMIGFSTPAIAHTTFNEPALRDWIASERSQYFGAVENAWLTMVDDLDGAKR
jgi:hypothetical protein